MQIKIDIAKHIINIASRAHTSNDAEFERKHPRDKDGRFGAGSEHKITIDRNLIGDCGADKKAYIKKAQQWYKNNLQGTSVNNPVIGTVNFYGRAFTETKDKNIKNINNLKYLPAVRGLIKHSRNVKAEIPKHARKDDVFKFHKITGTVIVDNHAKQMYVLVAEDNKGNKYYSYEIEEGLTNISGNESHKTFSSNSITYPELIVNIFFEEE